MRISGVDCKLPSNEIDNHEVLDLIRLLSKGLSQNDIRDVISEVQKLLHRTEIITRYWRKPGEKPIDLIRKSYKTNLERNNIPESSINALIYVSVDRGFVEPANASIVAHELGLSSIKTFDISDACMGWCTATEIAQSMFNNGYTGNILIVTSEFPMNQNGSIIPGNFDVSHPDELRWKFPSYTLGESATTTVLSSSGPNWNYDYIYDASRADLCVLPLHSYQGYTDSFFVENNLDLLQFYADGRRLFTAGFKKSLNLLRSFLLKYSYENELILPHSVASTVPKRVMSYLPTSFAGKMYSTFARTGNVATSSIPTSLYFALESNELSRNDHAIGWVASGGLKYSAFDIFL